MKYSVVTFGCRVNQADSLGFEEELRAKGGAPVSPQAADVVIVNTCSVTATADQGARQTIRRVARDNPSARIVVTGCYATRRPDEVAALPNVVQVVSNDDKPRMISFVRSVRLQPDLMEPVCLKADTTYDSVGSNLETGDGPCGAPCSLAIASVAARTMWSILALPARGVPVRTAKMRRLSACFGNQITVSFAARHDCGVAVFPS